MIDLKKFRTDNKIKQKEICEVLNIAQPYLSAIERGERPLNEERFKILYKRYGDILLKYKKTDSNIIINLATKEDNMVNTENFMEHLLKTNEILVESNRILTESNQKLVSNNSKLLNMIDKK